MVLSVPLHPQRTSSLPNSVSLAIELFALLGMLTMHSFFNDELELALSAALFRDYRLRRIYPDISEDRITAGNVAAAGWKRRCSGQNSSCRRNTRETGMSTGDMSNPSMDIA